MYIARGSCDTDGTYTVEALPEPRETIASGHGIHILSRLVRLYGRGNWRKVKGQATIRLENGTVTDAELHWFEAHGIGKAQNENQTPPPAMNEKNRQFAVCVKNDEYEASLELRKIYEVLDDTVGAEHGMIRVIDEEGEDYLYPANWFLPIELPDDIEEAIVQLATARAGE